MFNTSLITPSRLINHTEVEDRFPCYGVNFLKLFVFVLGAAKLLEVCFFVCFQLHFVICLCRRGFV